jgi:apoptosis-inducing factor 2
VGDIIDWDEQKQAGKVNGHVPVIVKNIKSLVARKPAAVDYKGSTEMIVVTNGKVWGITCSRILTWY